MKLNTKAFRYLASDDWRVLTAVEQGSKNHEVVPTSLIVHLSGLRGGTNSVSKSISTLAKADLIARVQNAKYDGYRLTYGGLDYLALHAHTKTDAIVHLGSQMGVGKESDIYLVTTPRTLGAPADGPADEVLQQHEQAILKLHRLGRTSFRTIRTNRTYHGNRAHCSWHYLSRLSASREYSAMCALHSAGYRVPRPIAWNRHALVMSLVPEERVQQLYADCIELALELAEVGVIHGDFNEFNIMVEGVPEEMGASEDDITGSLNDHQSSSISSPMIPWILDFPQITSLSHPQASTYFDRDIACIKRFFSKRYHFSPSSSGPTLSDAMERLKTSKRRRVDIDVEAAGFSKKAARQLEEWYASSRIDGQTIEDDGDGQDGDGDHDESGDYDDNSDEYAEADARAEREESDGGRSHKDNFLLSRDGAEVIAESVSSDVEEMSRHQQMIPGKAPTNTALLSSALYGREDNASLATQLENMSMDPAMQIKPVTRKTKAAAGWSI